MKNRAAKPAVKGELHKKSAIGVEDFTAGELSFDNGQAREPATWNFEFAFLAIEYLELAVRYEGGDDLGQGLAALKHL